VTGIYTDDEIRAAFADRAYDWVDWDDSAGLPDVRGGRVSLDGEFTALQLKMLVFLLERENSR
jgi:hypothetical protein